MIAPLAALHPELLNSTTLLLSLFVLTAVLAGVLFQTGWLGRAIGWVGRVAYAVVTAGFVVWRALLSWAPWPVLLLLVLGLHVLAWYSESSPGRVLLGGLGLLFLGVTACLAYVFIDLERYEVSRGYKVLHNPLKGQEIAYHLARYGHRVGIMLMVLATVSIISGFALLNQGLYETIGTAWYSVGGATPGASEALPPPGYADFLAYTLINLSRVVDLIDIANTYNYTHITYVHQARWPASTLLVLFKTFVTTILLQQIFASVRQLRLLGETIQELWSPHEPIRARARGSLPQHGAGAVGPLLRSLREVAFLTAQQRQTLPCVLAAIGPQAVPLLLKQLRTAPEENVRAAVVAALGHLGALEALPALVPLAEDPSEWVRQALVESLRLMAGPGGRTIRKKWSLRLAFRASGRWLGWALRVRRWIVRKPFVHPVELALATLRRLLADSATTVRARTAQTLGELGAAAVAAAPDLCRLLEDADESVRRQAAESLGRVGPPAEETLAALTRALEDPSTEVKSAAAKALGAQRAAAAPAVPALIPLLHNPDEPLRQVAAEALGRIGTLGEEATPQLVAGLTSEDNVVRAQTAEALGTIGTPAADTVPALIQALSDPNDEVRTRSVEALGKMGPAAAEAVPALARALEDADNRVAALAADALGGMGASSAVALPALLAPLQHVNAGVRAGAAAAIGKILAAADQERVELPVGRAICLEALAAAARDDDGGVRGQAIRAAGAVGSATAVRAALSDSDPRVRAAAAEALHDRGEADGETVAALTAALGDASDQVKVGVTRALARLGRATPEVVTGLCQLLQDDTPDVQASAALALGKLGPEARAAGEPLLRTLQTGDTSLREQVLRAVALIQPPEAATAFMAGLRDNDAQNRKLASAGLMKAEGDVPAEVLPLLLESLKDPDLQVRSNAAGVLGRVKPLPTGAVPLLAACATIPDDGLRLNVTRALYNAEDEGLGGLFEAMLADPNLRVRLEAARGMLARDRSHSKSAAVLGEALADPTVGLRKAAVELITSLEERAVTFVGVFRERMAVEPEPEVRQAMADLVARLEQQHGATVSPKPSWKAEPAPAAPV
jgi:HEAT repeat protein